MIPLYVHEHWTDESFDMIEDKVRRETRIVRFGPMNFFDSELKSYSSGWIGEVYSKTQRFKLFRVTGPETTSDLAVQGKMVQRGSRNVLVVKHTAQPLTFVGPAGLLVCVYALWFLLRKKMEIHVIWLILGLIITAATYCWFILRDLRKDINAITELLNRKPYVPHHLDEESEEIDDEEEDAFES